MGGNLVALLFAGVVGTGSAPSYGVAARIDRILSEFQGAWDLEIITAQNAADLGASTAAAPAPHAFAAIEPAHPAVEGFQPTEEKLQLLGSACDEMLATPFGQGLSQLIGRHVPEIQMLIRTRKRIAAVCDGSPRPIFSEAWWKEFARPRSLWHSLSGAHRFPSVLPR